MFNCSNFNKGQLNVDQLYNYTNLRSNGLTEKLLQELNYFYNHFRWREDAESILGEIQHYPFLLHALAGSVSGSKELVELNKSIKRSKFCHSWRIWISLEVIINL